MNYQLRPYQQEAIDKARQSFMQGNKKIVLTLATGAGKSVIARKIAETARGKVIYLTYRNVLIDQMRETFKGIDIEFGTLQKFGREETELYDLVIIDEVHWGIGSKLHNNINYKYMLGLSATPIDAKGNALDFDEVIDIVQLTDLIDMGYAAPVKVLSTSKVSTKGLKTIAGDFSVKEAYSLMAASEIKKDIVNVYNTHAKDLKTIIYCVNIQHAEELKEEFIQNGIECESVHSKKKVDDIIQDFRDNKVKVLFNVDILTTGLDLPDIYCLILASPTKSLIKATQIYGRATRLDPNNPSKEALIIDCAEVVHNTQHPLQRFDFTKKSSDKVKSCKFGLELKLIDRISQTIDDYSYKSISYYKCECGYTEEEEKIHVINYTFCEHCGKQITNKSLSLQHEKGHIDFSYNCEHCGHANVQRQITLTSKELEVIEHDAIMRTFTWEAVKLILKTEAKAAGYHWKWVDRSMEILQHKDKTPKEIIDRIKDLKSRGKKIGGIVYI